MGGGTFAPGDRPDRRSLSFYALTSQEPDAQPEHMRLKQRNVRPQDEHNIESTERGCNGRSPVQLSRILTVLSSTGDLWFRRPYRARGIHAARLGGRPTLGFQRGLS